MNPSLCPRKQCRIEKTACCNVPPLQAALPIHIQRDHYQQLKMLENAINLFCKSHASEAFENRNPRAKQEPPSAFDDEASYRLVAKRLRRFKKAAALALIYAKQQSLNISIDADRENPGTIRMFGRDILDSGHFQKDARKILCWLISQADMYTFSTMKYEGESVVLLEFIHKLYQNDAF